MSCDPRAARGETPAEALPSGAWQLVQEWQSEPSSSLVGSALLLHHVRPVALVTV